MTILRDPKYLKAVRDMPCLFTGQMANSNESVVPAHIGSAGKGIKSPDNEVMPLRDSVHQRMHSMGDITVLREAPPWLLREAFRAYAREEYAKWKMSENVTGRKVES